MTTVIGTNVIKISTPGISSSNLTTKSAPEYPRVCDYCRGTYNSELTFNRHKDTGKCYRFCRLREAENQNKEKKPPKVSIYPRVCDGCSKLFKNKHSFYKHKYRCGHQMYVRNPVETALLGNANMDVVELVQNDIENIPIIDNKENIDDFSSHFILTLDVATDKNLPSSNSLYPRICEVCHKVFKNAETFELHKINTKCSILRKNQSVARVRPSSVQLHRCENCKKVIPKQMYNSHIKICGKANLLTVSVLKKVDDFIPVVQNTVSVASQAPIAAPKPVPESSSTTQKISYLCRGCDTDFATKTMFYRHRCQRVVERKRMYPRTCEDCGFVFHTKHQFHRHKKRCSQYRSDLMDEDSDSFVVCDLCSQPFDTIPLYVQHMKSSHPEAELVNMPRKRRYMYPRKCAKCLVVYSTRQTFCNHKKKCIGASTNPDYFEVDGPWLEEEADKIAYPRTCSKCEHTYLNRQSFWNHKRLCQSFVSAVKPKEQKMYPRRCDYCLKTYSSKQTYHHHKARCHGFDKETGHQPIYPRTCCRCSCTYASHQSYYNHQLSCSGPSTSVVEEENRISDDDNMDHNGLDDEPVVQIQCPTRALTPMYPRKCPACHKFYANRHSFSKHKSRCVSDDVPDVDLGNDMYTVGHLPQSEPVVYPRECKNCFGTFKSETTFNAHKIRCDFFETNVNETEFKTYFKSNCEHCRNIVSQYRRIFHEHLDQCTDPLIVSPSVLETAEPTEPAIVETPPVPAPPPPPPVPSKPKPMSNSSPKANFCDCCGMFFKTRAQIEHHKRALKSSEKSLLDCTICSESFDSQEELADHTSRCVLNISNRTYPRFCECCRKIYKTKQTFYNHKKNCHVHCLKYFVLKDCENCKLPFKCEKMYFEHLQRCVRFDDGAIGAECEVLTKPVDE